LAIKLSEKESLLKSFILFFLSIELLLGFIFYHYEKIEEEHLRESIFLEMKNYSLLLEGDTYDIDIIPKPPHTTLYELHQDTQTLHILTPLPQNDQDLLKIFYPIEAYHDRLETIEQSLRREFLLLSLITMLLSLLFSLYVLHPLRESLKLLEVFIKDIIHDLNTPLTSILLELKMMDGQSEEVESITRSTKTISMLHHNLDNYLKELTYEQRQFDTQQVIEEQIAFFAPMYDHLEWRVTLYNTRIISDKNAFARILYNLLSNACKYNQAQGFVAVYADSHTITITNSSYGIKHPSRIFQRFYKEHERGLGIGLHIVQKLSAQLNIPTSISLEDTTVTITLDISKVTFE